jgi:hypothetical protein
VVLNAGKFFDGLGVGQARRQSVSVEQPIRDKLNVEFEGQAFRVDFLEFDAEFTLTASTMPIVEAKAYTTDDGERLVDVVRWQGLPGDQIKEMLFIGFRKKTGTAG